MLIVVGNIFVTVDNNNVYIVVENAMVDDNRKLVVIYLFIKLLVSTH